MPPGARRSQRLRGLQRGARPRSAQLALGWRWELVFLPTWLFIHRVNFKLTITGLHIMSKTHRNMSDLMACTHREFRLAYWHHKGYALGDPKPRIRHKPRHQPTIVESLEDADTYPTMFIAFQEKQS